MTDQPVHQKPNRLLQISESDLAELERILPQWTFVMFERMGNKERAQARVVKRILSDVRWEYGPPSDCEIIPADD